MRENSRAAGLFLTNAAVKFDLLARDKEFSLNLTPLCVVEGNSLR